MSLKIAVCDDEEIFCNEIKKIILELKPNYSIDFFHSGTSLLSSQNIYDIIFMDMEMPELDGIKTSTILRNQGHNEIIIFLTSHQEIIQDTFKVRAFRFLNKPIELSQFEEALLEAEKEILNNKKILVTIDKITYSLNIHDIICFEAFGDGTFIYTTTETFTTNKPLKHWTNLLGTTHFYQTHKSYFVNLRHIQKIDGHNIEIPEKKLSIPISRRKYPEIKKALTDYIRANSHYI